MDGFFSLNFDYDFVWPDGIENWSSETTDELYFIFRYNPSDLALELLEKHET